MTPLARKLRNSHVYGLLLRLILATGLYATFVGILRVLGIPLHTFVYWEMWQLLPREALQAEPFTSVWLLHGQPPLMNFLLACFFKLAGGETARLEQLTTIFFHAAGWAVCWVWLELAWRMTRRLTLAVLLVVLLLSNPSFQYFQTQFYYPHLLLLEHGLLLLALERWARRPTAARLSLATAAYALVVYTRSLWHPVVILPMLALAGLHLWRRFGSTRLALRQCAIAALVFAALVAPWMIKNQLYFNTTGFSSWLGINLRELSLPHAQTSWNYASSGIWDDAIVRDYYSAEQLARFEDHPALQTVVKQWPTEKAYYNLNHYCLPALSANDVPKNLRAWIEHPAQYWKSRLSLHIALFDLPPYNKIYTYDYDTAQYQHDFPDRWKTLHDTLYYMRGLRGPIDTRLGVVRWQPTPWYLIVAFAMAAMAFRARRIRSRRGLLCAALGGMYLWLTGMLLFVDGAEAGRMRWQLEPALLLMTFLGLASLAPWWSAIRARLRRIGLALCAIFRRAAASPWLPALALAALTLAFILIRQSMGRSVTQPYIFTDEIWHIEYARHILDGQGLHWGSKLVAHPNWLYPLFLAPWLKLLPFLTAYKAMLWSNTLAMSLTLPFTYVLARRYVTPPRALLAAALTALPVAMGYTATLMAESLWMPLGMLSALFMLRAMERPRPLDCIVAGLCMGLLYHVKPHGLFYPPLFVLAVGLNEALTCAAGHQPPARAVRRILTHALTAIAWFVGLCPRFIEAAVFEHNPHPLSLQALFGSYYSRATGDIPFTAASFALMLAANLAIFTFAVGVVPVFAFLRRWRGWRSLDPRRLALLSLTTVMGTFFILLSSRHTVISDITTSVYERYLMIVFPLLFIVMVLPAPARMAPRRAKWLASTLLLAAAAVLLWLVRERFWFLLSNIPSLAGAFWFVYPALVHDFGWWIPVLLAVFSVLLLSAAPSRLTRATALAAVLMAFMNVGWYGAHAYHTRPFIEPEIVAARKVLERIPAGSQLWLLRDDFDLRQLHYMFFYNGGRFFAAEHANRTWLDDPLPLDADGAILCDHPNSTWLIANRRWAFDRPAVKRVRDLALYRLGPQPLRLLGPRTPDELADPAIPPTVPGPAPRPAAAGPLLATSFQGVTAGWSDIDLPARWSAGRVQTVSITLANLGDDPWPSNLAMGYHWNNFPLTGSFDAVVWDDGNEVALPPLEPGQSATVQLRVKAPPTPHDRWDFILSFKLHTPDGQIHWDTGELHHLLTVPLVP